MTHIAERAPECPHSCLDDMFACTRCNDLKKWRAAEAAVEQRIAVVHLAGFDGSRRGAVEPTRASVDAAVEAVKNLFECAIGWMPWNFTTQDAADLSDELRADRDTAIRAIRGYV